MVVLELLLGIAIFLILYAMAQKIFDVGLGDLSSVIMIIILIGVVSSVLFAVYSESYPAPVPTPTPTPFPWPGCAPDGIITSCPCSLTVTGNYILDNNLTTSDTCITIPTSGSDSTLDCNGHSINGTGGYAIYFDSATGVTVENCVTNRSIYLYAGNNNHLIGNMIKTNGDGIILLSSTNNSLVGNTIGDSTGIGISLTYTSNYNNLAYNSVTSNQYGIVVQSGSDYTILTNNTIINCTDIGMYIVDGVTGAVHNNLANNTVCSGGNNNIICAQGDQIDLGGNICTPIGTNTACHSSVTCNAGCP